MVSKRKHPKFLRPNYGRSSRSRIKKAWRRPRGIDNKKRQKLKYMGASPSIGYGQPFVIRGFHPSGMPEVLVQSPSDVAGLRGVAVRIASGVGRIKRMAIIKLCEEAKLPVLNKEKKYAPKPERKEKAAAKVSAPDRKPEQAPAKAEGAAPEKKQEAAAQKPANEAAKTASQKPANAGASPAKSQAQEQKKA